MSVFSYVQSTRENIASMQKQKTVSYYSTFTYGASIARKRGVYNGSYNRKLNLSLYHYYWNGIDTVEEVL